MRKLLYGTLIFLILCAYAEAGTNAYIAGCNYGAACSYTSKDTAAGTGSTNTNIGYSTTIYCQGLSFTSASAYTAKRFIVSLKTNGDPVGSGLTTLTGYLCTDNAGSPALPNTCTSADATVAVSTLTSDYSNVTFNFAAGYSISNATRYWVAVCPNASNTSNNVLIDRGTSGTENDAYRTSAGTWASNDASSTSNFTTYSCE